MENIQLKIKTTSKIWMSLLCLTGFLIMGSVSSVKAQWCPSIYNVEADPNDPGGIYTTGSDVGVYYQVYRNGVVWLPYEEGTGGDMYWTNLCQGDYTIVTWKPGCADITLNYGDPVSIVGSYVCSNFAGDISSEEEEEAFVDFHEIQSTTKTNYAWFIDTSNTSNWLSKNL